MKAAPISFALVFVAALVCAPAFSAPSSGTTASPVASGSATSNDIIYRKQRQCECATDSGPVNESNTCCN